MQMRDPLQGAENPLQVTTVQYPVDIETVPGHIDL